MKTPRRTHRKAGNGLMAAGTILLSLALLLTGYNIWDDHRASKVMAGVLSELKDQTPLPGDPENALDPDMEMPTEESDGREYIGVLEIPALDLSLPVLSEWSMEGLRNAPCRYAGTAYKSGFVISGHNYQSHFFGLKNLCVGEEIDFTDVTGNVFRYKVTASETLDPKEVERMIDETWDLSLFTCTYSGSARYTVRCMSIDTGESGYGKRD